MPMTVIVTRDVPDRYRGFLASVMPEIGPGVFVSPELSRGVRERLLAGDVKLVGWNARWFYHSGLEGRCSTRPFGAADPWITAADPGGFRWGSTGASDVTFG
jgi:hypothetical protein